MRSTGLECSVKRLAHRRQAVLVLTRDSFYLRTLVIEQSKNLQFQTLHSSKLYRHIQAQSRQAGRNSLKNVITLVNIQDPISTPALTSSNSCSMNLSVCAGISFMEQQGEPCNHSQTSAENHLIAFHAATHRSLHGVSASLQHGCLLSLQTPATFLFPAHFIIHSVLPESLRAVTLHLLFFA